MHHGVRPLIIFLLGLRKNLTEKRRIQHRPADCYDIIVYSICRLGEGMYVPGGRNMCRCRLCGRPHSPLRRRRRQGGRASRETRGRRHDKTLLLRESRGVASNRLRGIERPVDCGDTRRRFRRRGLGRARADPRERVLGTSRCGRSGGAPRRRNRTRGFLAVGETR